MDIRVNRMAYPVTALGYGKRVGIWLQGCSMRCPGCASKDLWLHDGGRLFDSEQLAEEVASIVVEHGLDGMSITGGEPSEQSKALFELVGAIRSRVASAARPPDAEFDVLVFSGRSVRCIEREYPELCRCADTMICGPYVESDPSDRWLVASNNQEVCHVTELGRRRYERSRRRRAPLQCAVVGEGVSIVGITHPGDLDELTRRLELRGIRLEGCSWLSE